MSIVIWSYISVISATVAVIYCAPSTSDASSSAMNKRIAKICFDKHNLTMQDVKELHDHPKDPTKNMLCYMKCFFEQKGLIDKNGKLNLDNFDGENYSDDIKSYSEEDETNSNSDEDSSDGSDSDEDSDESAEEKFRCMKRVEPIKSCNDMRLLIKCVSSE
ncbi:hypothetical protein HHI36_021649 [Cryptolaemus montrouzieri]|uniref:Uncharacterized protein n=1 Tax=Cryptolaemus montrouzieri TaxID=559131 RepID=A0ABD2MY98_9CUCU